MEEENVMEEGNVSIEITDLSKNLHTKSLLCHFPTIFNEDNKSVEANSFESDTEEFTTDGKIQYKKEDYLTVQKQIDNIY